MEFEYIIIPLLGVFFFILAMIFIVRLNSEIKSISENTNKKNEGIRDLEVIKDKPRMYSKESGEGKKIQKRKSSLSNNVTSKIIYTNFKNTEKTIEYDQEISRVDAIHF